MNKTAGFCIQSTKHFYTMAFASHIAEVTFKLGKPSLLQYYVFHKSPMRNTQAQYGDQSNVNALKDKNIY